MKQKRWGGRHRDRQVAAIDHMTDQRQRRVEVTSSGAPSGMTASSMHAGTTTAPARAEDRARRPGGASLFLDEILQPSETGCRRPPAGAIGARTVCIHAATLRSISVIIATPHIRIVKITTSLIEVQEKKNPSSPAS